MAQTGHTFGPTCAYYEEVTDLSATKELQPPTVKAQFFYVSPLPIDDPLSPLPPISAERASNLPPRPFSARDNAALEEAWQAFRKQGTDESRDPLDGKKQEENKKKDALGGIFASSNSRDACGFSSATFPTADSTRSRSKGAACTGLASSKHAQTEADVILDTPMGLDDAETRPIDTEELQDHVVPGQPAEGEAKKHQRRFSLRRRQKENKTSRNPSPESSRPEEAPQTGTASLPGPESTISGRPFARAPSKRDVTMGYRFSEGPTTLHSDESDADVSRDRSRSRGRQNPNRKGKAQEQIFVPVGVSRLHLVEMPDLIMKPIYWPPINDTSNVIRATWFYKETMLPVPADVANRLEVGYEYMMPYGESYQEELQACINNGAAAEAKVVHKLWPEEVKASRPTTALDLKETSQDELQAVISQGLPDAVQNAAADPRKASEKRLFASHSVIYIDAKNAQILRPNLLPSVRQNRRPLNSLRKGRQIGVAVVRGFDRKAWLKIHPSPKMDMKAAHAKVGAYMNQSGDATTRGRRMSCSACERDFEPPKVSDLVLVIHGIGQKLSERVDSFHFTHAINGLRREFNVELSTEAVKGSLKPGSGMMVLPVNWRLTVSFDDQVESAQGIDNKYGLKDVTPDTLPGVRSLISDVMLDIPYYLSHHKGKMMSAVVREANRVYRLWCRNNPGFEDYGRVHLIAHSLGSVMAMEILSRQPTRVGKDLRFDSKNPSEEFFEFNTTNLFSCGSPSGFFLLLNNASLIPRKGRNKPGMEGEDRQPGIASEAKYGCLAVDNVYNICHRNDPISYLQNAAVDQLYAGSLQPASIPSVSPGLMSRIGNSLRWTAVPVSDAYATVVPAVRPELQHIPSTVEMETHNFTHEQVAEKRMYLLNDNGQIDWFLDSGGGPLEIQYLNMLSAHSSYWVLQDFVRFVVVEIGRKPGRQHTLPVLRAVKKREYKRGNLA